MTRRTKAMQAKISPRFKKNGKLRGLGKNTSAKIVGPRGRRVSIPRVSTKTDTEIKNS